MNFNQFKKIYQEKEVQQISHSVPDKPFLSVCVQTFQHKSYIKSCLNGILKQNTDFIFEILVGDDYSTDGTRELCLKYARDYPDKIRLFLHHRENNLKIAGKPSGRFNALYNLYHAKGKYIAFCEGDDFWTDTSKLQKQVDYLEKNSACKLVSHKMSVIDERHKRERKSENHSNDLSFEHFALNGCSGVYTCSMLFRNEEWFKNAIFNSGAVKYDGLDHIILLAATKEKRRVHLIEECMATYRIHEGGMWTSGDKKKQALYNLKNYKLYSRFVEFSELEKQKLLLITTRAISWLNRNSVSGQSIGSIRKVISKLFEVLIYTELFPFKIKHLLIKCFLSVHSDRIRREYRNLGD